MSKSNFDIKALLEKMTVEEKVGQLIQVNAMFLGDTEADITGPKEALGLKDAMIKTIGSTLNFKSFKEVKSIQDKHMREDRNKIPLITIVFQAFYFFQQSFFHHQIHPSVNAVI